MSDTTDYDFSNGFTQLATIIQHHQQPSFAAELQKGIAKLTLAELPLQKGLQQSSVALDDDLSVMLRTIKHEGCVIKAVAAISYNGMIAGCSCADDPTPLNLITEMCEVELLMDTITGMSLVTLLE
ncbi:MAG: hypothetical protein ISEC1_P0766 [Thiomicrorhabdus sp.]|nr:MAG: hypothetical protein ISEC1_P0766 [Thiomicrorhabdus sp.]